MATLTPTLTIASTDVFASHPINLTVTDSLAVEAPMSDISRMNTDDNIGQTGGASVIIPESTDVYFVYVKHTGILASDGKTLANVTADYITLGDVDGTANSMIRLYPGEFAFFPLNVGDGSGGSGNDGGLKVTAGSAAVQLEFAYLKRS